MAKVAVVVSSAVSLPQELIDRYRIHVVPERIIIDDKEYRDGIDINPEKFYSLLETSKDIPYTSAPSTLAFADAYEKVAENAERIVCITVTKGFSSMEFRSATIAKESLPYIPVSVIDSRAAPGAYGFVALAAAKSAMAGNTVDEVIEAAEDMKNRVTMLFTLNTLKYLAKGGRIGKAAFWASGFLDIKPIMEIPTSTGAIEPLERVRTRKKSLQRLIEIMKEKAGTEKPVHVIIDQANVPDEAESFKSSLSANFNCSEIYINDWPLVAAVHCGPGAIGVSFYTDP